jgi:hypothetical protein
VDSLSPEAEKLSLEETMDLSRGRLILELEYGLPFDKFGKLKTKWKRVRPWTITDDRNDTKGIIYATKTETPMRGRDLTRILQQNKPTKCSVTLQLS